MRDNLRSEKPLSKIGILSLGCPRNLVDSENILGLVKSKGYPIVDIDKADVAIINTCSFIEEARLESIEAILDLAALKKEGRLKKIIVYGCLPQRYRSILKKELPEVDAFVGRISLNHSLIKKRCGFSSLYKASEILLFSRLIFYTIFSAYIP